MIIMAVGKASALWYLLPVFVGLLGGIIGYFILRKKDAGMARNLLIAGAAVTFLAIALQAIAWMYMSSYFGPRYLD